MRSNLPTFTSHITRTRGGVGQISDDRTANRLEEMGCTVGETTLPGELRSYSKRLGQGQHWDFFVVMDTCAHCGEEHALNIVSLCGTCARQQLLGEPKQDGIRIRVQHEMANFKRAVRLGR